MVKLSTALPPDVRWRLCPTAATYLSLGAAPRSSGHSPKRKGGRGRKVRDLPHIGRQSRKKRERL